MILKLEDKQLKFEKYCQVNRNLIFDVGMGFGEDSRYYLDKGFKVVAVEADPTLIDRNKKLFAKEIADGLLEIVPKAIHTYTGTTTFFVNEKIREWGTLTPHFVERNAKRKYPNTPLEAPCILFEEILQQYETPYYIKIDIEGADLLCIKALNSIKNLPKYVSLEIDDFTFDLAVEPLRALYNLGYKKFKLVDQSLIDNIKCPNPPIEGEYVDTKFTDSMSGPFGEETPGKWMTIKQIERRMRLIVLQSNIMLEDRKYFHYRIIRDRIWLIRKRLGYKSLSWFDLHAKLA